MSWGARARCALVGAVLVTGLRGELALAAASQERLYVINGGADTISVIDPATGGLAAIPAGPGLRAGGLAVSRDGALVYVTNLENDTVSGIDTATLAVTSRIPVGRGPDAVWITPNGRYAYVTSGGCGTISVVDTARRAVVKTLPLGYGPGSIRAIGTTGSRVYAVSESVAAVRIIDTASHTIVQSIPFDYGVNWELETIASSADGHLVYITHNSLVLVLDAETNALFTSVDLGEEIDHFAVAPNDRFGYAAGANRLFVIDLETHQVSDSIETHAAVRSIAFTPDSLTAYLTTPAGLFVVDTASHSIDGRIAVSPGANQLIVAPDGRRLYVIHGDPWDAERLVSVVDTATCRLVAALPFSTGRLDLAVSPDSSAAHVATDSGVSVIDPVSGTIRAALLDTRPVSIATTPDGNRAYVTKVGTRTIDVLDTATNSVRTVIGPIDADEHRLRYPSHVAFSHDGTRAYVTYASLQPEAARGAIAVFDTTTTALIATIPIRDPDEIWSNPRDIVIGPKDDTAYVTLGPDRVAVVDLVAGSMVTLIDIRSDSQVELTLAISPDGSQVYVGHSGELDAGDPPLVAVIDTATGRLSRTIGLGGQAVYDVAFAPDGTTAYVTQEHTNPDDSAFTGEIGSFVSVIDVATGAVSSTIPLATKGTDIAISADGASMYVVRPETGDVAVIDTTRQSVVSAFSAGNLPSSLAIGRISRPAPPLPAPSPTATPPAFSLLDDAPLVVVTDDTGTVSIIDGGDIRRVTVGGQLTDIAITPDGRFAYVTVWAKPDEPDGTAAHVSIIDIATGRTAGTIPLNGDPFGIAITPDGALAYAPLQVCTPEQCDGAVAVIDTAARAVATTIPLAAQWPAGGVTLASDGIFAYVGKDYSVVVIDTRTSEVVSTIPVHGYVTSIALSPHVPLLTAVYSDGVSAIDTLKNNLAAVIPTGFWGERLAIGPDGRAFVTSNSFCSPLVAVVDTVSNAVTDAVLLDDRASAIALTGDGRFAYLATSAGVTILDTSRLKVVGAIPLDHGGSRVALSCRPGECPLPPTPIRRTPPTLLPTRTPTPTPIPAVPTRASTPDLLSSPWVKVGTAVGAPGETAQFDVTLRAREWDVAGVGIDLTFSASAPVSATAAGAPDCWVNPDINKNATAFAFQPWDCLSDGCTRFRAIVLALDKVDPIPDGSVLFSCRATITSDAVPGRYALVVTGVEASDPDGDPIEAFGVDGSIIIVAESTVGSRPGQVATPSPTLEAAEASGLASEQPGSTGGCQTTPGSPGSTGLFLPFAAALPFWRRRR